MSWKKHFQLVPSARKMTSALVQSSGGGGGGVASSSKFSSYLPEVYAGQPNRIERYAQYDQMDMDPEIHSALDIIADFCTQVEEREQMAFDFFYKGQPTEAEIRILNTVLRKWCDDNEWKTRLWETVRGTLKYGDQFFIRDPETYELIWVDHNKVEKVIVNEAEGKEPDTYLVRDLDLNLQNKVATAQDQNPALMGMPQFPNQGAGTLRMSGQYQGSSSGASAALGNPTDQLHTDSNITAVEAKHMVHVSMNVGNDNNWPFGTSILESVFKVFKQKELLEDALIIYRVQRAPERRVFYIDIGNMPPTRAKAYLENVKNEIHQRRIPNRTGGGSSIMDAAYNPMCLSLDTKIPLLDGRELELTQLIDEYSKGKENWVYSCEPTTGKIVPGNITWAGVTRKNTEVIKLTFDNGKTLICTPDHKIPVLGKGFVEAQNLTPEDSLISFETREKNIDRKLSNERTYTQVYDHEKNSWKYVHRVVGEFFRDKNKHQEFTFMKENLNKEKDTIHHKDFNRYNNDPRNLQWMNKKDHISYHVYNKKSYWENISDDERNRVTNKISQSLKLYYSNVTDEQKHKTSNIKSNSIKLSIQNMKKENPDKFQNWQKKSGKSLSLHIKNNSEYKEKLTKRLEKVRKPFKGNVSLNFTQDMLQRLVELTINNNWNRLGALEGLPKDDKFMSLYTEANTIANKDSRIMNKIQFDKISDKCLKKMLSHFGYKNWKDFKQKTEFYNHRVIKIEKLDEKIDVGTITVDGEEKWHDYHTFAISSGVFVKNSIIEDYFFAQGSEGKGSKVDTLPGGENLGEIDDLKYFDNKLKRGLGVPPSYLPSGPEEGTQSFSDGRVGTAYMQEWRFSKTCERYQDIIIRAFDDEFKLYLSESGYQIDEGLYDVVLRPPQNFSKFRQIEIDTAQIGVFSQLVEQPFWSKRFLMERFLQLDEDEILRNEQLFLEENPDIADEAMGQSAATAGGGGGSGMPGLEAVGAGAGDAGGEEGMDLGGDEAGAEDAGGAESPISGAEDAGGDADTELPSA